MSKYGSKRLLFAFGLTAFVILGSLRWGASTAHGDPIFATTATKTAPIAYYNVDEPGRTPFQAVASGTPDTNCVTDNVCQFSFGTVPSGHRLVIQQVSISAAVGSTPPALIEVGVGMNHDYLAYVAMPVVASAYYTVGSAPVQVYIDAGEEIDAEFNASTAASAGFTQTIKLAGYMLDCSTMPCNPIAY